MNRYRPNNKAHALILSMAVLMLLSIMAIQFSGMTTLEMRASQNFQEGQGARMVAQAGIEFAIANIREGFEDPLYNLWRYRSADSDANADPQFYANLFAEDEVGAGVSLTAIQTVISGDNTNYPSFATDTTKVNIGGVDRMVSGWVNNNQNQVFTLKVFDVASQININSFKDCSKLATVLDNLSWAIAQREPYKSSSGFDSAGPLHGLGTQIFNNRPTGGYQSKSQLVGISDSTKTISESDLQFVFDYITVYPRPIDMTPSASNNNNTSFQRIRFATPGNEKSYQDDLRSPVNINTASWPVLVAIFKDIGTSSTAISSDEAIVLANCVCLTRLAGIYFTDLTNLFTFLDQNKNSIFTTNAEAKSAIVKANANPSVFPRRLNPDKIVYQSITKADMTHHTTEFCYSPLGFFEIGVLGECFDPHGVRISVCQHYTIAKIFDLYIQATQKDFEQGSRYTDLTDRITNKQGFSQGNNLLKSSVGTDDASKYFGMLQPVCYNSSTGCAALDDPKDVSQPGGTAPLGEGGKYTFKADFNGTPDANKGGQTTAYGTKVTGGQAVPNDNTSTFSDFAADGVVFNSGDTNADALYYLSRPHEAVETLSQAADFGGNMPPIVDDDTGVSADYNQGTMMFWLKINSDWKVDEWRTVCFSNTAYDTGTYHMGIQKEVQMKITEPDTSQLLLRKAEIKVRSKYYCLQGSTPVKPPDALMPYTHVDSTQTVILDPASGNGIQAQQWYHLAVRWKNGNTFNGFANDSDMNVCVRGNFYNSTNVQQDSSYRKDNVSYPGCDGGLTAAEYATVKDNPPATTFQAIAPSLTGQNRLYLGCVGCTNAPQMTIDDVRITAPTSPTSISLFDPTSVITAADYAPSRFSLPDDQSLYAEFKGTEDGTTSVEKLFVQSVALDPSSQASSDTSTSGSGSGTTGTTPPTDWAEITHHGREYGLPITGWQAVWNEMSNDSSHTLTAADLELQVKEIKVKVKRKHDGTYEKEIKIKLSDNTWFIKDNHLPVTAYPEELDRYTYDRHYHHHERPQLGAVLIRWYHRRYHQTPEGFNDYTPVVATLRPPNLQPLQTSMDSNYDLKFKAGSDINGIFESCVVVQIVTAKTCKLLFLEFLEQR